MKRKRKERAPIFRVHKISKAMTLAGAVVSMMVSGMKRARGPLAACLYCYFPTPDLPEVFTLDFHRGSSLQRVLSLFYSITLRKTQDGRGCFHLQTLYSALYQ